VTGLHEDHAADVLDEEDSAHLTINMINIEASRTFAFCSCKAPAAPASRLSIVGA